MAGITTASTVTCITMSPMTAELVVATASGSASDAASAARAMAVQRSRARGVRRSRRASSSQPNSEAATVTPMTWPIAIVWMSGALYVAGAEADVQVDAQQGDFHDPGESSGQCAARSAQRPGAALLDVRHGGSGGGKHVSTPLCGSRRPVAPLITTLSRA